jgi:hypothetical protein
VPDGDDVVMKGNDDEVRGEQSFSAFPQVRAVQAKLTGIIPVKALPIGLVNICPCVSDMKNLAKAKHGKTKSHPLFSARRHKH